MELLDGTRGPAETLLGVAQVAHDVAVLPPAAARPGPTEVGRRRGPIVHGSESA